MYIVHIASEMAPIAKVGGLGDVVTGLSRTFNKMRHRAEIILPKYSFIDTTELNAEIVDTFPSEEKERIENHVYKATVADVPVFLIEPLSEHFQEDKVYVGGRKDLPRFIYFCKAALDFLQKRGEKIDILHLHDWHTSLIAPFAKHMYPDLAKGFVLSIHNLCYQGACRRRHLKKVGFAREKIRDFTHRKLFFKRPLLLKAGLVFADAIIAVSPSYAKEILTRKKAEGLLQTLEEHHKKITGILNGIDEHLWDPATDEALKAHFSKDDPIEKILEAKKENKRHAQKELGLEEKDAPLIVSITRLVLQKSPKLIKAGLLYGLTQNAQSVLLGSSPTKSVQGSFERLAKTHAKNPNIHFHFHYNETLSRLLFAAADFLLMPSKFEPCGLTQMIALRYGCIPIVHETGGLKDTVFDEGTQQKPNGFTFTKLSQDAQNQAIDRALSEWHKDLCKERIQNGMQIDFSWEESAKKYEKIYQEVIR